MEDLALGPLLMGLFGGLSLFLFGMDQMTDALRSVAGSGLSKVLANLTKNRFVSAITGAFVTAVVQSSSVTTVLVVGFITAGLMSLQQSVGIIMGANVGSTITAQIVAFKVTEYALALITLGFGIMFFTKKKSWRLYGAMIMGLGLIFGGMGIMSDATTPLRSYQPFIDVMRQMDNPLLGILAAAIFTALVQSSSATTGIVIVLATQGFVTLEAGIALAFGANIGTCVTAAFAALGKPRPAVQAAVVHLLFNVAGVLIWLPLIGVLSDIVVAMSPAYPELEGTERLGAEAPRQIANAHTLFNVINTFIFIGFAGLFARLATWLFPERPEVLPDMARPKYIQDAFLETPALALDGIRREAMRLGQQVEQVRAEGAQAIIAGTDEELDEIVDRSRQNQLLYDSVNEYIRRLAGEDLTPAETRRLAALTSVAAEIQHVGETNAVNFVHIGRQRLQHNVQFNPDTLEQIRKLNRKVVEAFELAISSLERSEVAQQVIAMKPEIQELAAQTIEYLGQRLTSDDPHRALLYRLETQSVELLQREYYFAKKIAKAVVREAAVSVEDPVFEAELATVGKGQG